MTTPQLVSINVALPRELPPLSPGWPKDPPWRSRMSGIYKESVERPVWLGTINRDGDRQADLKNHGGEDKAVGGVGVDHYPDWHAALARLEMTWGEAMATLAQPATHLRWIPRHAREKGRRVATYE